MLVSTAAHAQEPYDLRTNFTFNQPVQLPGVELPAGEYIFRLADPDSGRKVVQVISADRKEVYAMLHTIPRQRAEAADEPEVSFMETAAGVPPAIQTWWHRGERRGREFMYSEEQIARIARADVAPQPEITMVRNETAETTLAEAAPADQLLGVEGQVAVESQDNTAAGSLSDDANAADASISADANAAVVDDILSDDAEPGAVGTSGDDQAAPVAASGDAQADELPQTGGTMPLVGLVGILALGSGLGIRRLARARVRV
jgi:hypothetical protein